MVDPDGGVAGGGGGLLWKWVATPNSLSPYLGYWTRTLFGNFLDAMSKPFMSALIAGLNSSARGVSHVEVDPGMVYEILEPNGELQGYIVNAVVKRYEEYPVFSRKGEARGSETWLTSWDESFYIDGTPEGPVTAIQTNGQSIWHYSNQRRSYFKEAEETLTLYGGKEATVQKIMIDENLKSSSYGQPTLSPTVKINTAHIQKVVDRAIIVHRQLHPARVRKKAFKKALENAIELLDRFDQRRISRKKM